jgi:uncharacterized protein with FMN-binding domain
MKKFLLSSFMIVAFVIYSIDSLANKSKDPPVTANQLNQMPPTQTMHQTMMNSYKDGEYMGNVVDAYYGNVQVKAVVQDGKIADIQFLAYPNDRRTSISINSQAMPLLKTEAIQSQSANVNIISGATQTSLAFRKSLQSALTQAI